MKYLKYLLDFYLNSSIHVAMSVYALTRITILKFDLERTGTLLYFVFFATITGYNFVKYFGVAKWHHRSLTNRLKVIQVFSLLCFIAMCYYGVQLSANTLGAIAILGVITFIYAIPFIPKRFYIDAQKNLRSVSGLKIYVIAAVWSGVTVILPIVESNGVFNQDVLLTFFQIYILVMVLLLPFEIRDLKYDNLKLTTVPQKIGIKRTKILGCVMLFIFFLLEFFKNEINVNSIFYMATIALILFLFLLFAKKSQGKYYSAFWVEGLPILWLFLVIMFG